MHDAHVVMFLVRNVAIQLAYGRTDGRTDGQCTVLVERDRNVVLFSCTRGYSCVEIEFIWHKAVAKNIVSSYRLLHTAIRISKVQPVQTTVGHDRSVLLPLGGALPTHQTSACH